MATGGGGTPGTSGCVEGGKDSAWLEQSDTEQWLGALSPRKGGVSRTSWAMGRPLAFTLGWAAALSLPGRSRVSQGSDS